MMTTKESRSTDENRYAPRFVDETVFVQWADRFEPEPMHIVAEYDDVKIISSSAVDN